MSLSGQQQKVWCGWMEKGQALGPFRRKRDRTECPVTWGLLEAAAAGHGIFLGRLTTSGTSVVHHRRSHNRIFLALSHSLQTPFVRGSYFAYWLLIVVPPLHNRHFHGVLRHYFGFVIPWPASPRPNLFLISFSCAPNPLSMGRTVC